MKIKLSTLRQIIREVIDQQSVVPGKWDPVSLDPLEPEDVALMGSAGLGDEFEEEEENLYMRQSLGLGEAKKKKKKGLWANIHAKRARGEKPAKPGDEGYPKTLDI